MCVRGQEGLWETHDVLMISVSNLLMFCTRTAVPSLALCAEDFHGSESAKNAISAVRAAAPVIPRTRSSSSGWRVQ